MGWSISHAPYGEIVYRSATQLTNLGSQVAHVSSARDWRVVLPLFDRVQRATGPFEITWAEAGRMADVLKLAACHSRMPDDWGQFAHQLADAADTAAKQREPWLWR
ncbi:hypothetical protein [Streptomyces sp. NPDC088910]|uniref:DUF7739 domain-containing protein n=1 Tax=unclassified Streptomyces TaxID=2593676 RepID=UPI00382D0B75